MLYQLPTRPLSLTSSITWSGMYFVFLRCHPPSFNPRLIVLSCRIIHEEAENKMSLQNVATVFGPTLLRLSAKQELGNTSDKLAAGTIDVMAQAGILYFYLKRQAGKEASSVSPHEWVSEWVDGMYRFTQRSYLSCAQSNQRSCYASWNAH